MGSGRRTRVTATNVRVHLGEMLRRLEDEDLVIEKGGVPVAILTRYRPAETDPRVLRRPVDEEYERALVKREALGGWEVTMDAIREGWSGIDADEMIRKIYESRAENARRARYYDLDRADSQAEADTAETTSEEATDARTAAPARLRYLHRPAADEKRVADGGTASYDAGAAGDHADHVR